MKINLARCYERLRKVTRGCAISRNLLYPLVTLRNQKGLTLIELVMAMLMLSIVMVGSTSLESSVIRFQTGNIQSVDLQNQLGFAYRKLDLDLGDASLVMIDTLPLPTAENLVQNYRWRIRPSAGNANGSDDIEYRLDLRSGAKTFKRIQNDTSEDLLPPGTANVGALVHPVQTSKRLAMWTSANLKLLTLNLAVDVKTAHSAGNSINPGYEKSFLIRTGKVMDCRSGTCA